ncbi:MAG TPA: tungsten formylmethanofuran dehydrogenase, partial [Cytophagales bacterium]|nr:tungsten formylmethanofuran dehydrogenase [Cytophagales bacterium]
ASAEKLTASETALVITYGMGVYWAREAATEFAGQIEIVDLRTLNPIDWDLIIDRVKQHGRVLVLTEEPVLNSFAESLAGRISQRCFIDLDAPVSVVGAANLPAVPLNMELEKRMLPNASKVATELKKLLAW